MASPRQLLVPALWLFLPAIPCPGQALVEYAAGAAVGTAGSAGGRAVSSGIDKVFRKTGSVMQKSAASKQGPVTQRDQRISGLKTSVLSASVPSAPVTGYRSSKPRVVGATSVTPQTPVVPPAEPPRQAEPPSAQLPAPPAISAADLAAIAPGTDRQQLIDRIGSPAFKVRIQGDGHVQEIYRYSSGGVDLGSVRVVDGSVAAVKPKSN